MRFAHSMAMSCELLVCCSWRQRWATVRTTKRSVEGLTSSTFLSQVSMNRSLSCVTAIMNAGSMGMYVGTPIGTPAFVA